MGDNGSPSNHPASSHPAVSYRQLVVWQKAMALMSAVYQLARSWPTDERFGLVLQARRAALSVPANIAEGKGRVGAREYRHHLSIARGSLWELETLLLAACDLQYHDEQDIATHLALSEEVGRMLSAMIDRLDDRAR